jgi:hypothetical protein
LVLTPTHSVSDLADDVRRRRNHLTLGDENDADNFDDGLATAYDFANDV